MEGIKIWIASLSAVTFIMAVISAIVPKNTAGRVCVLLGEIVLISALISPFGKVIDGSIPDVGAVYRDEVEKTTVAATEACEKMEEELICEKLSSYVLDKAEATGEIYIQLSDKTPVSAEGVVSDEAAVGRVKKLLREEFGIPEEKQGIKVEGE